MKKGNLIFVLLILVVTAGGLFAQVREKSINKSGSNSSPYTIVFHSYPKGKICLDGKPSKAGHVFVEYIGPSQGDSELRGMNIDESFFSTNWGQLQQENSALRDLSTKRLRVRVNKTQFDAAKAITGGYYFLGFNDCVTYAKNVAEKIGIEYSWTTLAPDSLLDDFLSQN